MVCLITKLNVKVETNDPRLELTHCFNSCRSKSLSSLLTGTVLLKKRINQTEIKSEQKMQLNKTKFMNKNE